jgi:4'-phosphopantetheinyl transferase
MDALDRDARDQDALDPDERDLDARDPDARDLARAAESAAAVSAWPLLPADWSGPAPGKVDCVRVPINLVTPAALARLRCLLTGEEVALVGRYARRDDRVRAVVARAAARLLLARAKLCPDPRSIVLETGEWGKPFTPGGPEFNVSHGGDVVLLGFSRDHAVGIDVEPVESGAAWREVMPRLHPLERAELAAASDPALAFVRIWTRKEAVAKAAGTGLALDPGTWAVSLTAPGVVIPPPGGGAWTVFDLAPAEGHAGNVMARFIRATSPGTVP